MAGDTIAAAVRAFYGKEATPQNNPGVPAEQMLAGLFQAFAAPAQAAGVTHAISPQNGIASPPIGITAGDLTSLKQKDPNNNLSDKPKAYLNYVFFDNRFKFVDDGSGVKQVDGDPGQLETLASGKVVAKKNGYVYVYTSNESQQNVLFDNLTVQDITGPVLEETHYYPFGLTMAGISTVAPLKLENNYKFNGIELNHKEFSDGSGLELYTAKFRGLDPQIGRWWQIDPKPDYSQSPYAAMSLNPVLYSDFLGDTIIANTNGRIVNNQSTSEDKDNFIKTTNPLLTVTVTAKNENANNSSDKQSGFAPGIPISPVGFSPKPIEAPKIGLPEVGVGALDPILWTIALVLLPVNWGQPSSDHLQPRPILLPSYYVPPKALPGFPNAEKIRSKTGRARWRLSDGSILEWDYQHGRVEKYDPRGKHQGEFDPNTGDQTKPRNPGRRTEN